MGDRNDAYYEESRLLEKQTKNDIDDRLNYLNKLTFEQKVEIMFEQFKKDEKARIIKENYKKF